MNTPSPHGELIQALLPPVSYDPQGPLLGASCTADGYTLDRSYAAAQSVLQGLIPFQDITWLAAYEAVYALPQACFEGEATLDERIIQLSIALRERYGVSREFYYWLGAVLGYSLTIEECSPFVASSCAGQFLYDTPWQYAWRVRTLESPRRFFRVGRSHAGDPLQTWGDARFECIFRKFAPAYTIVHFAYGNGD